MTTGTPLPAFEHDPLPDSTTHFRLLHIIRGDFEQHVECNISTWPIDSAPPYYAISYTWGDPEYITKITVNGKPLVVRRNCEYVLQQAFTSNASRYFWVDAICIAQNTEEKNHQVGIMGEIYSGAKHVFAFVGPHENDSEFLVEFSKRYRSLLGRIRRIIDRVEFERWKNPIQRSKRLRIHCLRPMSVLLRQRLWNAFLSFMQRPYFKQVWVMQKLHLAEDVTYSYGPSLHSAGDLLALYWLLDLWTRSQPFHTFRSMSNLVSIIGFSVAPSRTEPSWKTFDGIWNVYNQCTYLGLSCTNIKSTLDDLVFHAGLQCNDPRDRLFGVLSLVDWPSGEKPVVDYQKDRFEVALQTSKFLRVDSYCVPPVERVFELSGNFEVTGKEPSLLRSLAARSCASRIDTTSGNGAYTVTRSADDWSGQRIDSYTAVSQTREMSREDQLQVYMPMEEHNGECTLEIRRGTKIRAIKVPCATRRGDWFIFARMWVLATEVCGLIVRGVGEGRYSVLGQTYPVMRMGESELGWNFYGLKRFDFIGYWNEEDAMILAWTVRQLRSEDIEQDQIRELINRQVCAWEGSSYFKKFGE